MLARLKNSYRTFRFFKVFIRLVKDPTQTQVVFQLADIMNENRDKKFVENVVSQALADSGFRQMYERRDQFEHPKMEDLSKLPKDTYGYALYRHLHDNNLSLDIFPRAKANDPLNYLKYRIYAMHDYWHPLLGFNTSIEEELAVQAVGCAQFGSPLGLFLITAGFLHLLMRDPIRAVASLGAVSEGHRIGRTARYLPGVSLNEMLSMPLSEVRAACNIHPYRENSAHLTQRPA